MGAASNAYRATNQDHTVSRLNSALDELVYDPRLVAHAWGAELVARRDDPTITPWGMWGAVLAGVVGFMTLVFEGWRGFHNWYTVGIAVLLMAAALLTARFGPRTSLVPVSLARIDLRERQFNVGDHAPLPFSDVQEVVYGMVKYPIERGKRAVKIEAFTVLLRNADGDLLPLFEATPDKNEAFRVARACAQWTGRDITHVGLGVK